MISYFHYIEKFKDEARTKARDRIFKEKLEINEDSKHAAIVLRFFDDESISDKETFGHVRKRAYKHIERGKFSVVSDYLQGFLFDYQKMKWEEIIKLKFRVSKNLRPIFKALTFSSSRKNDPILNAIQFLKSYFSSSESNKKNLLENAPIDFLPKSWVKHLMLISRGKGNQIIDIKKYEFMLYQQISQKIESGDLHIVDSVIFKDLSDHLISNRGSVISPSKMPN
ncbi:MAG: hypothetical protein JSS53_08245 [Proteobacteria bacterium]|nr:hypothetical protein [Pseudomonadota bacterium]